MKRSSLGAIILSAMAITVLATVYCTYSESSGKAVCTQNANCATYKDPVPIYCNDVGSTTGKIPDIPQTNVVTVTIFSLGTCSSYQCEGGTPFSSNTETNIDTRCKDCPAGG